MLSVGIPGAGRRIFTALLQPRDEQQSYWAQLVLRALGARRFISDIVYINISLISLTF